MITTEIGQAAEETVAAYLKSQGFKIIARNWRRKACEVDIIAQKAKVIYFVEVKFRRNDTRGDGLSSITPTKLKQMEFAARIWCQENRWQGDWRLVAAGVELQGGNMAVKDFIELY